MEKSWKVIVQRVSTLTLPFMNACHHAYMHAIMHASPSPIVGPCLLWPNGACNGWRWHCSWRWALVQATLC